MNIEAQTFYPGETATAQQILMLAKEYRRAADALLQIGRKGHTPSRAPYRLVAIHAIELYLNALLLAAGHPSPTLRRLHHNLATRTELALTAKLKLRGRTTRHLQSLSQTREYLISRYDPNFSGASELNRLAATLAEVAEKVTIAVDQAKD